MEIGMATFVRGSNPVWSFVDLTGHQFDDTFYMFVLENTIPYMPSTVYHTPSGIPWAEPIQFLANGTLPIDIFWDANKVYRLEFRQGPTQFDPLIYEVNNYSPGGSGDIPIDVSSLTTNNQITNPQFSFVNFATPFTLTATNPDPLEFAPGWFLNVTGSGTATFQRVALTSTLENPTNAPYAVRVTLSGTWTGTPYISQRFNQNGMLWSTVNETRYVSNSITARTDSALAMISAQLYDSMGTPLTTVLSTVTISNAFAEYIDHGEMPETTNTDTPPDAWIEYRLFLPTVVDIYLTSFQLISSVAINNFEYIQDSIERQQDYTFHYFKPKLEFKQIPSLLVGWNFSLNPAQFGVSQTITTTAAYMWDQTIAKSVAGNVTAMRAFNSDDLQLTTTVNDEAFYLLQYLEDAQALETTFSNLCVNIAAYSLVHPGVVVKCYLAYSSTGGTIPMLPTSIGTLNNLGEFTLTAANWSLIPQALANFSADLPVTQSADVQFKGWLGQTNFAISATNNFAIIVTFKVPTSGTQVIVTSIGLMAGDIPTRPAPQTPDEVLRECQYYFEKSYAPSTAIGAATAENSLSRDMSQSLYSGLNASFVAASFTVEYKQTKRTTPAFAVWSIATLNTPNVVTGTLQVSNTAGTNVNVNSTDIAASPIWNTPNVGTQAATYTSHLEDLSTFPLTTTNNNVGGTGAVTLSSSFIQFHYVIDARLGIV